MRTNVLIWPARKKNFEKLLDKSINLCYILSEEKTRAVLKTRKEHKMYTIYYILNNRMDFARAATIEEARKRQGELIMAGAFIQCVKDQNGEIMIL